MLTMKFARQYISFLLPAGLILTIVATGLIVLAEIKERLIVSTGESMAQLAAEITDKLDLALSQAYGDIQIMARNFTARDSGAITEHLHRIQAAHPIYQWIAVTDKGGQIVASTEAADIGRDQSRSQWFEIVRVRPGV